MKRLLFIAWLGLAGCTDPSVLENLEPDGELVVVTRNGPTTYYLGADEPAGFEYELIRAFADSQEMRLRVKVAFTLEEVFETLQRGEAHIAAAGLTESSERNLLFESTQSYLEQHPVVVYKAGQYRPRSIEDLSDLDIIIMQGSQHAMRLTSLQELNPQIRWRVLETAESSAVLKAIDNEEAQVALLDSSEFSMQQRLYPRVAAAFQLQETLNTVWYLGSDSRAAEWRNEADHFLTSAIENGALERMKEAYFGNVANASRIESFTFQRAVESNLPDWQPLIERVASEFRLDWRLLAAISYQESHWNPKAKSPTGVRGMMMLTRLTAGELGIDDRTDARQSLRGGARFFKDLLRRLPADIEEPHRTSMALAAYTIGMGHLEDARVMTQRAGGNPHHWPDVRAQLPKLQNPEFFPRTKFGFAEGQTAVTYVDNIRHYEGMLALQNLPGSKISPPISLEGLLPESLQRSHSPVL